MTLSYSRILGRKASWRVQAVLCPGLRWNQERYGSLLISYLDAAPKRRWLEAGCGRRVLPDGLLALELSAVRKAGLVVGMDVDERSVFCHRSVNRRVCASLAQIPFADESFDVVGCNMVVEHLSEPQRCLSELARVLSPDGVMLIHTPNLRNYMVFLNHLSGKILPRRWILWLIRASEGRPHTTCSLRFIESTRYPSCGARPAISACRSNCRSSCLRHGLSSTSSCPWR